MSGEARSLEGVTLAVKDDTDLEGKVTASLEALSTMSHRLAPHGAALPRCRRDHPCKDDGAGILHLTVTTSHHWGTTRNP